MMAAEEDADMRGLRVQRKRVIPTTCVQNSRIILGKYLNVKPLAYTFVTGSYENLVRDPRLEACGARQESDPAFYWML